jgi:hypothetical protein
MSVLWVILGMYFAVVAGMVTRCTWYNYMAMYVWDSTPDYMKYEEFSEWVGKLSI